MYVYNKATYERERDERERDEPCCAREENVRIQKRNLKAGFVSIFFGCDPRVWDGVLKSSSQWLL